MDRGEASMLSRKKRWYRKRTRDKYFRRRRRSHESEPNSNSESYSSDTDSSHKTVHRKKCNTECDSASSRPMNDGEDNDHDSCSDLSSNPDNPDEAFNTNDNPGTSEEGNQNSNEDEHVSELGEDQDIDENEGINVNNRVEELEENPHDIPNAVDANLGNSAGEDEPGTSDLDESADQRNLESGNERDNDSDRDSSHGEEELQDENEEFNYDNEPIFNGAQITFRESLLAILTFVLSHKLTGLCINDLLALIALHCSPNNLCLKTLHKFKTYFKMIGRDVIVCHYFCSVCEVALISKDSVCEICRGQQSVEYFIEFPIISQLQSMFGRQGFYQLLQFRFNRVKKNEANIEEVYDGLIYQQLGGFFANPNNLRFFMYFDGISLFKSSSFSIWPVYLSINELKYKLRTKKENMILAGIWFGKSKPNPNLFLQPIHNTLSLLETEGVDLTLPNGENVRVRTKLLGAVGDMPAKSTFMRFTQYNGAFSCFSCMAHGERFDLGNNTSVQVYPYTRNIELRNNHEIEDFAMQAVIVRQNNPEATVYGVKGPSLLSAMLPNMILCVGIDIMHGVFLGVMRTLMNLWFDSRYSTFPFSLSGFVHIVDVRLKAIKPPSFFTRVPRSIKKELAMLKASDLKIFMFYYSLPLLVDILPDRYWIHHKKLVTAIAILCQESISQLDIGAAEELLHSYVSEFSNLYGLRYLSLTFHQLLHLPMFVRNLGPAWVFSCFFYESLNGQLARLVHGSRYVALQICSASSVYMNLSVMINSMNEGEAKALCLKFQGRTKQLVKITEIIDHQTDVIGKMKNFYPVPVLVRTSSRKVQH